jgi:hypothetical protein
MRRDAFIEIYFIEFLNEKEVRWRKMKNLSKENFKAKII